VSLLPGDSVEPQRWLPASDELVSYVEDMPSPLPYSSRPGYLAAMLIGAQPPLNSRNGATYD
jgi:hypothetical protein